MTRFSHPQGKVFALLAWAYFVVPTGLLLAFVQVAVSGGIRWDGVGEAVAALAVPAIAAVLAVWLFRRAVGHRRRQAFYLYPEGYILTAPSGRVVRVEPWREVYAVTVPGVVSARILFWSTEQRTVCEIVHRRGRKVKFAEVTGREVLAPLLVELHAAATGRP